MSFGVGIFKVCIVMVAIALMPHVELITTSTDYNRSSSSSTSESQMLLWALTNLAVNNNNNNNRGRQNYGGYGLSYPPPPPPPPPPPGLGLHPGQYPATQSIVAVLHSIARNDRLHCVPKLLCELMSSTSSSSSSSSLLPFNVNMESLLGILSALASPHDPLFVFGRAALLGYVARSSCGGSFPQCPTDPDALVHYLNNYNGGFFRYFDGAPPVTTIYGHQRPRTDFTFPDAYDNRIFTHREENFKKQRGKTLLKFPEY